MNEELTYSKKKHEYSNAGLYHCPRCQHMFEETEALQTICSNCIGGDKFVQKPMSAFEKLFDNMKWN